MDNLEFLRIDGTIFFGHEMTIMKLARDILFLLSSVILLHQVFRPGTFSGISMKTQILYTLAFGIRMLVHFPWSHTDYEVILPTCFFSLSVLILMLCTLSSHHLENENDSFWLNPLMLCTNVLALLFNYSHLDLTVQTVLWAWSHYLEAVAALPQMWIFSKMKKQHGFQLSLYVHILASYRVLDILHWIYLYYDVDALDHLAFISDWFHLSVYCGCLIYKKSYKHIYKIVPTIP